ncbi:MAG: hypothetical protein WB555_24220, partial [Candidatus Korobacteraceae bacterium]
SPNPPAAPGRQVLLFPIPWPFPYTAAIGLLKTRGTTRVPSAEQFAEKAGNPCPSRAEARSG